MAKGKGGSWLRRLTQEGPRSKAELVEMLRAAARGNLIDADALRMIQGVLRVDDLHVRDIMVPRSQMVVLERDSDPGQLLPAVLESGHSRFPVIGDDRDQIVGILLAKDLLRYFAEGAEGSFDIREVLRPAAFIPESKRLNVLLKEFRVSHHHMAIVVDEYGGVAGLVTIEDVLEQIVGEIDDEYDHAEAAHILKQDERRFLVSGLTPMDDPFLSEIQRLSPPQEAEKSFRAQLPPWQTNLAADDYVEYTWHAPTVRLYVSRPTLRPPPGYRYPDWSRYAMMGVPTSFFTPLFTFTSRVEALRTICCAVRRSARGTTRVKLVGSHGRDWPASST
jgi:magnesium and cobalt transporter